MDRTAVIRLGAALAAALLAGCAAPGPAQTATPVSPTATVEPSATPIPSLTPTPEPTLAPTPGWTRREPYESVFGVEMAGLTVSQGLDLFPSDSLSPTTWVRLAALSWRRVEPVEGQLNWEAAGLDSQLQAAADRGLQIILVVREAPAWAAPRACGPVNAEHFPAFGRFVAAASQRYPVVQYWEMWNEPDIDFADFGDPEALWGCWGDRTDAYYGGGHYGEMLKAVYPALKAANPQAQLVAGALLFNCDPDHPPASAGECRPGRFLEGLLRAGGGAALDGVSFHAYDYYGEPGRYANLGFSPSARYDVDGPVLVSKARAVRRLLEQYGVTGKFLMNTEAALLNDAACQADCETAKAWYVAQTYAAAIAEGLRANLWFRSLGWPGRNTALLTEGLQPRPAYIAYQTAAGSLRDAVYQGEVGQPGVAGYRFDRGDARVWVVWSRDGGTYLLDLPASPTRVTDVYGQPVAAGAGVSVTYAPVYVWWP